MVAVVTGAGLGVERSSAFVLGSRGQLGSSAFGRYGENVYVNAATGNLAIERQDELLIGVGLDDNVSRSYNSLGTLSDDNGDNWQLGQSRRVTGLTGTINTAGSTVTRYDADGSDIVYSWDATRGAYASKQGSGPYDTLSFAGNVWTWTDGGSRQTETYDALNSGRVTAARDSDGNMLAFTYTGTLLTRVTTQDGEHTDYGYTGNTLTQVVTTRSDGTTETRVRYGYDSSNRLSTVTTDLTPTDNIVTDGQTVVTTYSYDGTSKRVASISQTGGARLAITYALVGSDYRVASLVQTQATGVTATTTFSYDTTNRVTTVTDAQGNLTRLSYDASGNLTTLEQPAATSGAATRVSSFVYDASGNVTSITDAAGDQTAYAYDANGNLTLSRDAAGDTVAYTYDTNNNRLTETHYLVADPDGAGAGKPSLPVTTRYAYDAENHLVYTVSDVGRVTRYDYAANGLLTRTTDYATSLYDTSALGSATALAAATLDDWTVGIADKSGFLVTATTYDARGNIATVSRYTATDATTGAGLTTSSYTRVTYVYDQAGNLLSRHGNNAGAPTETFVYDGLNRLIGSTDLAGNATSILFTDASNSSVITAADGSTTTRIYDLAGELLTTSVAGSGVAAIKTLSAYDTLGNLRMVTNALGQKNYFLYDDAGRQVAAITADGALTETVYDAADRVASSIRYVTKLTSDQLASLIDAAGKPANVDLSTLRPAADVADSWDWNVYDADDRLVETIGAAGSATVYAYDGTGQLVKITGYATPIAAAALAGYKTTPPTSLQLPTADGVHDRVTRRFYSDDGLLAATLDGDGALTQYVYDGAGEKTRVIASATLAKASLRPSGTLAQLVASVGTNAADEQTDYVYDDEGQLRYTIDENSSAALGTGLSTSLLTEFAYDLSGNLIHTLVYGGPIAAPDAGGAYTLAYVQAQIASLAPAATAANRLSHAIYDTAGRLAFAIDAMGNVTQYVYDDAGRITKTIDFATPHAKVSDYSASVWQAWGTANGTASDRTSYTLYDAVSRPVYQVDAEGYVTENQYDALGRVTKSIRYPAVYSVDDTTTTASLKSTIGPLPATAVVTTMAYDTAGRMVSVTNGVGAVTYYVYDTFNRVTDVTVAYGTTDAATTHSDYDAAGHVVRITRAYGTADATATAYSYDGLGRTLTITTGSGTIDAQTTNTYDALGNLVQVTDATGAITQYQYDAFGNVVKTTDPRGSIGYSYYDQLDRLVLQIDPLGYATATTYSTGNAVTSITRYATATAGVAVGTPPSITANAAEDATTSFTLDLIDRVTGTTDAMGYYEQYTLDAFGDRVAVRNKLGGITTNVFDGRGLLVSETLPENSGLSDGTVQATAVTNSYAYDARGNRIQMIEAAGLAEQRTTAYAYDKMDRLVSTTHDAVYVTSGTTMVTAATATTPVETIKYDMRGNIVEQKDAAGARTLSYYDDGNRRIAEISPTGTLSTWTYDDNGNALTVTTYGDNVALPATAGGAHPAPINVANYRRTSYSYDKDNRELTSSIGGLTVGSYNGTAYSSIANQTVTTRNVYDAAGNLIQQVDGRGNSVFTYYDQNGNKIAQVDQSKYLTSWTLDGDGNVVSETRYAKAVTATVTAAVIPAVTADSTNDRTTTFTYDRNGRRLTETRLNVLASTVSGNSLSTASNSATVTYTYNGLGEVLTKTEATGNTTAYGYDIEGRQLTMTGAAFTDYNGSSTRQQLVNTYDGLDNLTRTVQNGTRVTTYGYGAGGRLASVTDPTGFVTTSGYDAVGRLVATSYTRAKSDGSTATEGRSTVYDAAGRAIAQHVFALAGGSWAASGDSTEMYYNAYGDVIAKGTNSAGKIANAQEFADYDAAGRVWRTNIGDGVTKAYVYDANGNATMLIQTLGTADLDSYADLNAILADNSGTTQTFSVYDARNALTDTIQVQSTNAGANPVHATQLAPDDDTGIQYFNANIGISSSNTVATGSAASTVNSTSNVVAAKTGSVTFTASGVDAWEGSAGQDHPSWASIGVDLTTIPVMGGGTLSLYLNGTLVKTGPANATSIVANGGSRGTDPVSFGANSQVAQLYQEVPTGSGNKVLIASASFSLQASGPPLTGAPYSGSQTVATTPSLQFQNENPNTSSVLLLVRAHGSTGPYTVLHASPLTNSGGAAVAGWFTYNLNQAPFNGLPAGITYDIKYLAEDAAGNIYDAKKGTLSVDASGNPTISLAALPVNGPGQADETWDGASYTLLLSGFPLSTQTVTVSYRVIGSGAAFTPLAVSTAARGGAYGQAGLWSGRPPASGGPYEYWVSAFDSGGTLISKSYGTFTGGGEPSALTQYSDKPETITLTPPAGQTITSQQFRYFSGGAWSAWITNGAAGTWNYDAGGLVPNRLASYSYPIQYETYNGAALVSHTEANVVLGYGTQSVSGLTNAQGDTAKVLFAPQQPSTAKIIVYWRDKGSTGAFTATTLTSANGYAWDVDAAGVRPVSGTRTLEYYFDSYDASNKLLPTQNGDDHSMGTITLKSDRYTNTVDTAIVWVIDTKAATQYLIHRKQSYDAFGEIASETDGNNHVTMLSYNTEGKLTLKQNPTVAVTDETGVTTNQATTEQYYYDASGRQVGQRDANGNLVTQVLLAGSGYDGGAAVTLVQYAPSATTRYGVDVFGDVRKVTDALGNVTLNSYDADDRLIEVDHAVRAGGNSPNAQLKDYYIYDALGQRIEHWNSQLGAGVVETTDYDAQGRVTMTRTLGGQVTSYAYTFLGGTKIVTSGLGAFGGWQTVTTNASGLVTTENKDIFGNLTSHKDFGGHLTTYSYDMAGHLTHQASNVGQSIDYTYYSNGYVQSITDNVLMMKSTFEYDNQGNRTLETYNSTDAYPVYYQNAAVRYDAMNRVVEFKDAKADITYRYDANGNRREVKSVYSDPVDGSLVTQDYWYKYDSANRFVLTMGRLSGGVISTGTTGVAITYDANGNRATATYGSDGHKETYSYTADGYLENMSIAGVVRAKRTYDAMGRVTAYSEYDTDGTTVTTSRTTSYDNDNRVLNDVSDTRVKHSADAGYDTVHSSETYDYKAAVSGAGYSGADQGVVTHIANAQYTNGDTAHQITTDTGFFYQWWDEAKQSTIRVSASDPSNPNSGDWAPGVSKLTYDVNGHLLQTTDAAGQRVLNYESDAYGQVLVREEKDAGVLGPRQLYYYFNGNRIGDISNNGPSASLIDYGQTLASSGAGISDPKGGFRTGKPVSSADFDENYQPVNAQYPGSTPTLYTVQGGDTLQSIAQATWGDSALWYLIADANGLSGAETLVAGQRLSLPNKVTNIHNNSGTFRVYDPGEAIGDTLPTLPAEPAYPVPAASPHHHGCGVFGQILLVAVAVAVTYFTAGTLSEAAGSLFSTTGVAGASAVAGTDVGVGSAAAIAGSVAAGALGSVVSQGLGLATGLQDRFSFTDVALAGIGAGVGGALAPDFGDIPAGFARGAVSGLAGNVLTQGISVATGLQNRFDWASVAAAAIGGGVGGWASLHTNLDLGSAQLNRAGESLVTGMASSLAGAATRSLINGTDFGDNILATLPDVLGQTIGNLAAGAIAEAADEHALKDQYEDAGLDPSVAKALAKSVAGGADPYSALMAAGGQGAASYTPANATEQAAYDNAYAQSGDAASASAVAWQVDIKNQFEALQAKFGGSPVYGDSLNNAYHVLSLALLSSDAYFDQSIPQLVPTGWSRLSDADLADVGVTVRTNDPQSGFFAAIYRDGSGDTVVANRGTEFSQENDREADVAQNLGLRNAQYDEASELAPQVVASFGNVTFTGHSLGGGLAGLEALVTGGQAVTFNEAALSVGTLARYNVSNVNPLDHITNYDVDGEALQVAPIISQDIAPQIGRQVSLPAVSWIDPMSRLSAAKAYTVDSFQGHKLTSVFLGIAYAYDHGGF